MTKKISDSKKQKACANPSRPCFPESYYCDEQLFAMLYTAQEPNLDWTSIEALQATNPLMWEVDRETLISDQKKQLNKSISKMNLKLNV